ncbi:hypothetical protein V6N11_053376 [Hibiscus sabdariffa]|uniref:Uncharacterized protein n=1 Tax=Hibiscus sabdariffa TaxID=183260 RepID=A0ABR2UD33_9ROSI
MVTDFSCFKPIPSGRRLQDKVTWRWRGGALVRLGGPSPFGGQGHLKVVWWSPQLDISSTGARLESLHRPTRPPQSGEVLPVL